MCLLLLRKPLKTVKLVLMLAFLCLQWLSQSVGLSAIILVRAVNRVSEPTPKKVVEVKAGDCC